MVKMVGSMKMDPIEVEETGNLEYNRTNLLLTLKLCKKLETYLDADVEYSGALVGRRYGDLLILKKIKSEIKGDNSTTSPPVSSFTFHTHPWICYQNSGGFSGWPSGMDMVAQLKDYDLGIKKHYIVSVEGIYSMSLTIDFTNWWDSASGRDKLTVFKNIDRVFTKKEGERHEDNLQHTDGGEIMFNFLRLCNNYSLMDALPTISGKDSDTIIFIVTFKTWDDIWIDGGFLDLVDWQPNSLR